MDIEMVTDGLVFPEGPVWMKDGSVIVVEVMGGTLRRVWPDGRKEIVSECGGGPNGAAVGPDGMLYVCNNGGLPYKFKNGEISIDEEKAANPKNGWIDRIDPKTGKAERLYEECDGRPLSAPNDIVFDYEGGIWFSDFGKEVGAVTQNGGIYYAKPDGSFIKRAVDGPRVNGIGLSPGGKKVYGAISFESLLLEFDVEGPGVLGPTAGVFPGRVVTQFKPRQTLDSLAVDAEGNVCVALCMNEPGIGSAAPDGTITHYPFPDAVTTNICFGGADMQDAWVTLSLSGRLAKVRWPKPGLRLAHYA
jgi:gluconolactonase